MRNVIGMLRYQRSAEEVEADYARFCKLTKPLLTMGVLLVALVLVSLISEVYVFLLFAGLPVIVGIRGRAFVPALLRGRLSWTGMAIVGVACGVGSVLLSMLIGLPFLNPPTFQPEGMFYIIYLPFLVFLAGSFTEEMLFQVGLQTVLQRFGPIVAVIGATMPFWGVHLLLNQLPLIGLLFNQMPFLGALIYTLLGCLTFGMIRQTTKSTGAAIIANSVANLILGMVHPAAPLGGVW